MKNMNSVSFADSSVSKITYFTFLYFNLIWLLLIFAAPYLASMGGYFLNIADVIYIFFSGVCHQDESRSFHLAGNILGVCSRCTLIYTGFFAGMILYPAKYKLNNTSVPSLIYLMAAVFLLLLDVISDMSGFMKNTFLTRSITGFFTGIVLPFYLIPGFVKFFDEVVSFLKNKLLFNKVK